MKSRKLILLISVVVLSVLVSGTVFAFQSEEDQATEGEGAIEEKSGSLYELIQSDSRLDSFEVLIEAAGLADDFDGRGSFTVFAPTNEAMAALQSVQSETEETLTDILLYHVVNGEHPMPALRTSLATLYGERLLVDAAGGTATVNRQVEIVEADIQASNGVLHVIDAVLALPEGHELFASEAGSAELTIPDVLAQDGRFETFLSLAEQAGLTQDLANPGARYTLFAPTDEAFAAVPEEMMDDWLASPDEALRSILAYHIVEDELEINQIATDDYIPTLEGRALVVSTDEDLYVYLNGRAIDSFNILAANGVIHVVDEVILP